MSLISENLICMVAMLAIYAVFCVLWPMFLLRPLIKGKSLEFQVVFAQVSMNLYITIVGYLLAFARQFNRTWLILLLIVLPLLLWGWYVRKRIQSNWNQLKNFIQEYREGLYGPRLLGRILWEKVKDFFKKFYDFWLRGRILQIVAGAALTVFVVCYFGFFKLHHYAYAYTDEETHLYWIQSVLHGNAFPTGLYPHAMHFLVATMTAIFSFETPVIWHMFSILIDLLVFQMLYFCLRTLLPSRAAGIWGIGLFLLTNLFTTVTYFRYQYSLPMEFGFASALTVVIGFVYYIRNHSRLSMGLFMMAIIWTFQAHFYATFAAAFLGMGCIIVFLPQAIKEKILHKILIGAVLAQLMAFIPFALGYVAGFTFERSIAWGLDILNGGSGESTLSTSEVRENAAKSEIGDSQTKESSKESFTLVTSDSVDPDEELTDPDLTEEEIASYREVMTKDIFSLSEEEIKLLQEAVSKYHVDGMTGKQYILQNVHDFVSARNVICLLLLNYTVQSVKGVLLLYGLELLTMLYGLLLLIRCHRKKESSYKARMILMIGCMWACVFVLHIMPFFSLPALLEVHRSAEVLALISAMLFAVPMQAVNDLTELLPVHKKYTEPLLVLVVMFFLGTAYMKGYTKKIDSLYYNFAIQNLDMKLCQNLLKSGNDYQWTVISPVNDLSALRFNGYHYEIVDLLDKLEAGEDFYIPTPDIYVVVEKEIPNLSTDRSDIRFVNDSDFKDYAKQVDPAYVTMTMAELGENKWVTRDRAYYDSRDGVMSKFYYWMEKIKEVYPAEVSVYLKDDYCTVYHIHQDRYFLLNLKVDYQSEFELESAQQ